MNPQAAWNILNVILTAKQAITEANAAEEEREKSKARYIEQLEATYEKEDWNHIISDLSAVLSNYKHKQKDGLTVKEFAREELANAYELFPIPPKEKILAFLDATIFGNYKKGIAFGLKGIYLRNSWPSDIKEPFMSWSSFSEELLIEIHEGGGVRIGQRNVFGSGGALLTDDELVDLLKELNKCVMKRKKREYKKNMVSNI
jgi:hypothetical protein